MNANRLASILLILLASCRSDDADDRARLLASHAAERLNGTWSVTFQADANSIAPRREHLGAVTGVIAFVPDRHGPRAAPGLGGLTHEGAYDVDFTPFGFSTRGPDGAAVAVARVVSAPNAEAESLPDSLYVVLSPETDRFPVRMSGAFAGDSAWGVWSASAFSAGGGSGRFVMRHHAGAP